MSFHIIHYFCSMNIHETYAAKITIFQHYACNALENNALAIGGVKIAARKRLSHSQKPYFRISSPRACRHGALPFAPVLHLLPMLLLAESDIV